MIASIGEHRGTWDSHPPVMWMQNGTAILEKTWQFRTELNVDLLYDPLTLILGTKFIFNHKMKTYIQKKKAYAWM